MSVHSHLQAIVQELGKTLEQIDAGDIDALLAAIDRASRVFTAGAGRSGLVMRGFAMRLMHLGCTTHVVGETTTPAVAADDLLLVGSGSGATPSVLSNAQKARAAGASVALITTAGESPIGRLAGYTIVIPAPTPKIEQARDLHSVQPMGSLFEQSLGLLLDAMVIALMAQTGQDQDTMYARHANLE